MTKLTREIEKAIKRLAFDRSRADYARHLREVRGELHRAIACGKSADQAVAELAAMDFRAEVKASLPQRA